MAFERLPVGTLAANAYILYATDRDDALVIDPGAEPERIVKALGNRRLAGIVLTHGHMDHIGAVAALRGPEVSVYIHRLDAPMLTDARLSLACTDKSMLQSQGEADVLLDAGEVTLAGLQLSVLHTPGHTPGGICIRYGDDLFTGDTLFRQGYGRTDLPGGDMGVLTSSLRMLLSLEPGLRIHPGHGGPSTIGEERRYFA